MIIILVYANIFSNIVSGLILKHLLLIKIKFKKTEKLQQNNSLNLS